MKTYTAKVSAYGRLPDGRPYGPGDVLTGLTQADVRVLHLSRSYYYVREGTAAERLTRLNAKDTVAVIATLKDPSDVQSILDAERSRTESRVTVIRAAERRLRALGAEFPEVESDEPIQTAAGEATDS